MKRWHGALAVLLFLWLLQALLVPKYQEANREGALISEYYANAGDNDVIFIGDCEVYENFSPITLWEEYGIPSCIRGSPQQMIWQSYYLMEETLRYEKPKVMVFNVLSMQYDSPESTGNSTRREAYNRMTLDGMRWSSSKWNGIQASMTKEERQREGLFTYFFPILRYHDRWYQLTREDFQYWLQRKQVSHNGYLMQTGIRPATEPYAQPPRAEYRFGENAWKYLEKMTELCEAQDVKLVLIKSPSLYPVWWWEWDQQIEAYAKEKGLLYINMLEYQQEIGIDWNTDTYDAGLHLNVYGAEKASRWLGKILMEEYDLTGHKEDPILRKLWEIKKESYDIEKRRNES